MMLRASKTSAVYYAVPWQCHAGVLVTYPGLVCYSDQSKMSARPPGETLMVEAGYRLDRPDEADRVEELGVSAAIAVMQY